jgi:hypothetical protein
MIYIIVAVTIYAHSWYPPSCCTDSNCHPIDCAELKREIAADPGWNPAIRQSQDELCHICKSSWVNLCAFMPVEQV